MNMSDVYFICWCLCLEQIDKRKIPIQQNHRSSSKPFNRCPKTQVLSIIFCHLISSCDFYFWKIIKLVLIFHVRRRIFPCRMQLLTVSRNLAWFGLIWYLQRKVLSWDKQRQTNLNVLILEAYLKARKIGP